MNFLNRYNMKRTLLSLVATVMLVASATAQTSAELKQRMKERKPAIDEMKQVLVVGENNQAYLTMLKTTSEEQALLVKEENSDRKVVYTLLAKQVGATIETVQLRRAAKLRELATPGTMIQTEEGEWIAKP